MPPSLETSLSGERTPLVKKPLVQTRLVFGDGVVSRPADRSQAQSTVRSKVERRTYTDGPLPCKPSQEAPRDARIVGRVAELGKLPYFTLKVGDVEIDDVGLHEILEYVSPYELERFEHQQFVEEREALAAAVAAMEVEEEMRRERGKERAKRKGIIVFEELEAGDADSADAHAASGKFGRARPTYKHLFKQPQERRRRRKRDPITNELLPLSDDEAQGIDEVQGVETINLDSSEEDLPPHDQSLEPPGPGGAPKRRRRRRDPQTGALLPLQPISRKDTVRVSNATVSARTAHTQVQHPAQVQHTPLQLHKRPPRRRHPQTGELMPLGWRYGPDTKESSHQARPDRMSPSMRKMSISQEQQAKRVKLASESSADESLRQAMSETTTAESKPMLHDATQSAVPRDMRSPVSSPAKSTPKTSMLRPTARAASSASSTEQATLASFLKSAAAAGPDDSDSDNSLRMPLKPTVRNTPTQGKTSIMQPVAADPSASSDEGEDDDNSSLNEGEWFVEAIVAHKMSDPRSLPWRPSVLLYHTKWEGSDELTWEPADSFVDADTLTAYRAQAGLDKPKQTPNRHEEAAVKLSQSSQTSDNEASDSSMDDGYEIEKILAHHMSDPRTHPGQPQTMLYKVKWVGFPESEATWEPRSSFPDNEILTSYRTKVGLRGTP